MKYQYFALLLLNWASPSCGWSQPGNMPRNQASTSPLHYATSNICDPAVKLPKSFEKLTSLTLDQGRRHHDRKFQLYCDLDGVLVDFAHGIKKIFDNRAPEEIPKPTMWEGVTSVDSFYEHLPWTPDGKRLWNAIQPLSPDILTGVPYYVNSRREKVNWCRRELLSAAPTHRRPVHVHHVDKAAYNGQDHVSVNGNHYYRPDDSDRDARVINVITCWAKNKHYESRPGAVLIDDTIALRDAWEAAGGIFIHHRTAEQTLNKLMDYGILDPSSSAHSEQEHIHSELECDEATTPYNRVKDLPMP